jgi:hypothetical protein
MKNYHVELNDVVQIFPLDGRLVAGCFGIVTKVMPEGIVVDIPKSADNTDPISVSVDWKEFVIIGKSVWRLKKAD